MAQKPYSEACAKNAAPILNVLQQRLPAQGEILEIASGTGQHAVYFAEALPGLQWQCSDLDEMHAGIQMWLDESGLSNVLPPLSLDVAQKQVWPGKKYDGVFSANTAHIMSMDLVVKMFAGVARVLKSDGLFLLYGPFMYHGEHTSESNERFDGWLKSVQPERGLRDVYWLREIAAKVGLKLVEDINMPANNRILVWSLDE